MAKKTELKTIAIDIKPLLTARNLLKNIVKDAENEYEQMGAVQAFEICYELAWKTLKKVLASQGIKEIYSPKEIFRKSYLEGTAGRISDLDICYQDHISSLVLADIREEFTESDLPFEVELVN
ncbi:7385_t:CDS:2 [Ambispora gerdemannii]|uniref:7385_t:CDS:1 n=1 Tax=Ambispora gerdemannii TaxID=144530 RepID=A0A9N9B7S6_9GLOM|nr:7385_t:CDS:2 [Ambispora gerdemannii]